MNHIMCLISVVKVPMKISQIIIKYVYASAYH